MISVVIPAYNEELYLSNCLNSLLKQNKNQQFEVIIVDNNSTDRTQDIVFSFKNKLKIHLFTEKHKGRGAARRCGFLNAQGDIILSTDADAILPTNWIEQLTNAFIDENIIAVTGTCSIHDCSFVTNFLFNYLYQPSTEIIYRIFEKHWCLIGPNFAVRKDAYFQTIGFDSRLNCREDADLSAKIAKIGKIKRISMTITFSGRRYKNGLFSGIFSYATNRVKEIFIGKANLTLPDVR